MNWCLFLFKLLRSPRSWRSNYNNNLVRDIKWKLQIVLINCWITNKVRPRVNWYESFLLTIKLIINKHIQTTKCIYFLIITFQHYLLFYSTCTWSITGWNAQPEWDHWKRHWFDDKWLQNSLIKCYEKMAKHNFCSAIDLYLKVDGAPGQLLPIQILCRTHFPVFSHGYLLTQADVTPGDTQNFSAWFKGGSSRTLSGILKHELE